VCTRHASGRIGTRARNSSADNRVAIACTLVASARTLAACAEPLVVGQRVILSLYIQCQRKIHLPLLFIMCHVRHVGDPVGVSPPFLVCGGSSGWFAGVVMVT